MAFENIIYEVKGGIAYVTLNRPEKLNALNRATMLELQEAFALAKKEKSAQGVILTGAGPKAFAAGADIGELTKMTPVAAKKFAIDSQAILGAIEHFEKPVIAAVNGFCLGGGNELAMACHLRWASKKAKFGQPEVGLGLICGNGGTQRLARLVGRARAIELIISGNMIDAEEACRLGLVNHVTEDERLIAACEAFLQTVFSKSQVAVSLSLEAVNRGMNMSLEEGIALEASLFGLACSTEDMKEGTTAFLQKRKAEFKGK